MKKVLIIGATGSLGRTLTNQLISNDNYELTLFARSATSLNWDPNNVKLIDGDVLNQEDLASGLKNQDAVFVALSGPLSQMATSIVNALQAYPSERLIFISSMGIYNEIPASVGAGGNLANNPILQPYRDAADIVADSGLNYTVIRPGWFDNGNDEYEVTSKTEPFGGHDVSRAAIADLVTKIIDNPDLYNQTSIGINRP
ncbi:NAD(P)H-binding protein [Lactobacillus sp. Sy-1]|uniref:NAD(P)H-binding protein n=1 Tax=Lactobacillus sp. Sy-1 TaxID=2109645 RepID=UPI001C5BD903|nr:NAD(P)H-binding protein [Lactobacillus sp. Sy-1]MBW1606188.1 NAD(P)H-binding protein [Lactobacillus sp. Sy-1]